MNIYTHYFKYKKFEEKLGYNAEFYKQCIYKLKQSINEYMPEHNLVINKLEDPGETVLYNHKVTSNYLKLIDQVKIVKNETDNIIFMDCDIICTGDLSEAFSHDFDIAFTETNLDSENRAPINGGVFFLRPSGFPVMEMWLEVAMKMMEDDYKLFSKYKKRYKGICQSSLAYMLEKNMLKDYKVKMLPCSEYNSGPFHWDEFNKKTKCVHFNIGEDRKNLISGGFFRFPQIRKVFFKYKSIPSKYEIGMFKKRTSYNLNCENPKTFNEKLAWKKHNDRNPLIQITADKIRVRDYVSEKGYSSILPELLWVGKNISEPEIKYGILKSNNSSQKTMIIHDKTSAFTIKRNVKRWSKETYGTKVGEWCYQNIEPCALIEKMVSDKPAPCIKGLCFHGKPEYFYYLEYGEDFKSKNCSLYNKDWELQDVKMNAAGYSLGSVYPNKLIEKPSSLNYIKEVCCKLSEDFQFVRVDLMIVNDKIYFSELTHYPTSGMMRFEPQDWDLKLGEFWDINKKV